MWTKGQELQSGRYTVVRRIGGGGFGLTYLATDSFFDRKVVIKTPDDKFQADQDYERYVRRFQREGQTLANIEHPNVVRVFGFFEEAGMPCLVMAYVEGETLHERLRNQGPLSEDEAVKIFRKLAAALHKVHESGIFHCDIHPGNVILQSSGEPALIDFGSAKRLVPTTVTVTTTINQSFSPYEQQNPETKTKATLDIYSLAATLFFTITGEKPISSINRKLYGDSLQFPQEIKSKLSPWFQNATLKGMALEEQERPSSMQSWIRLLYPPKVTTKEPSVEKRTVPQAKQIHVVNQKPISQTAYQRTSKQLQKQTHKQDFKQSRYEKRAKNSSQQHESFPWAPLSLFFLSNIPTGSALGALVFDTSSGWDVTTSWSFVLAGILFVALNTVWLAVRSRAMVAAGAGIVTVILGLVCSLLWDYSPDGVAGAVVVAWILVGTYAGVGGLTWAVILSWAKPMVWALAMSGIGAWAWALLFSLIVASTAVASWLSVAALTGAGFSFIGIVWASTKIHKVKKDAYWTGIGGSAISSAGFITGVWFPVIFSEQGNVFLSMCALTLSGLQIVLMVKVLQPIILSLSGLYQSKVKPFMILNTACVLGLLFGAVIAWCFFLYFKP
ncbi:MAG: protein kinase [Phormidesmis sp.]